MSEATERAAAGWPRNLWEARGSKVRLKHEASNGYVTIPAGTVGVIDAGATWERLAFKGEACSACGCQPRIARMSWRDFELVREARDAG